MKLTVVRHATAVPKRSWTGTDSWRPLDAGGESVAAELAEVLANHRIGRLMSSPATRCIQTLGPIAERLDLPIELWDGLGQDADADNLRSCITNPTMNRSVLCTHGEVMGPLLRDRDFRSIIDRDRLEARRLMLKGTAWRLTIDASGVTRRLVHEIPSSLSH